MQTHPKALHRIYKALQNNGFVFSTDSRKIEKGAVFFALKGDTFDGNKFASAALDAGAALVVVDDASIAENERVISLEDVLVSLQDVASYHRQMLGIPILALTGSNGKTTTKELIRTVLGIKYNVCATQGNLNNHIGVPLTLLSMRGEHDFAVVEMGANHLKEIELLCELAKPDFGYITNFGRAHLEGFGGVEGVINAKSELYTNIRDNEGLVFVNADDPIQMLRSKGMNRYLFSKEIPDSQLQIRITSSLPYVSGVFGDTAFSTQLTGEYNFTNAAAAITIGRYFGVPDVDIARAVEEYLPSNNRSQFVTKGQSVIMMDAYNANPSSMSLSIENFSKYDSVGLPKIAVLGDMFELGKYSEQEHRRIAELALGLPFERVYLVGKNFKSLELKEEKLEVYADFDSFAKAFNPKDGAYIVKGSRGMAMERFLDII